MHLRLIATFRGFRPLFVRGDRVLASRGRSLFEWQPGLAGPRRLGDLPRTPRDRLGESSRLARRVLRTDLDSGCITADGTILVGARDGVYRIADGVARLERAARGLRPLRFTALAGVPGFRDATVYGDYGANPGRGPMSIHARDAHGAWATVFTFAAGELDHIHSLVPDPRHGCVWILTGDYDRGAAIWRATDDFQRVEPVLRGTQDARACIAFPDDGGLIYATDSHLAANSIRRLERPGPDGPWVSRALHPMIGSCIFGGRVGDHMFFATAVEPGPPLGVLPLDLLDPRRGPGIARAESQVVAFDGTRVQTVLRRATDRLPKRLFQFSSIVIPDGHDPAMLATYGAGLRAGDDLLDLYAIHVE